MIKMMIILTQVTGMKMLTKLEKSIILPLQI